ncbi:hypothetical protein HK100_012868 [Physocladia obscura]|uniref:beta-glucosidase n=1 Tax=Physocladia obscura TaxID=109957 RepID=A0AAD5T1Y1_9FUNG|nr:hypothetical protein HK100_012868 [Physocladia obscura]
MAGNERVNKTEKLNSLSVDGLTVKDVPDSRLNEMVTRILSAFYMLGQDKGFPDIAFDSWAQKAKNVYNFKYCFKHHIQFIRELGAASTVLLKNSKSVLPLQPRSEDLIAVIGEDARLPKVLNEFVNRGGNDGTLAQGWGSGSAEFPYLVAPLGAISSRHAKTVSSVDNYNLDFAKNVASSASVAIVFVNADSGEGGMTVEGHDADRNDLKLWHKSDELIEAVSSVNENTVIVIHSVGAVEMPWINHPNISAVVLAFLPGQESGNSIADILFGNVNPSARLPFTIHEKREEYAAGVIYKSNGVVIPQIYYSEGLFFDYRHADKFNITPLFPFGHGLSYTSFEYSKLHVSRVQKHNPRFSIRVAIQIQNVGKRDGHEVVQVYVVYPPEANEPPKLLKGFERVWVRHGARVNIKVLIDAKSLRVWGDDGWEFVRGEYVIYVGGSSRNLRPEARIIWG